MIFGSVRANDSIEVPQDIAELRVELSDLTGSGVSVVVPWRSR